MAVYDSDALKLYGSRVEGHLGDVIDALGAHRPVVLIYEEPDGQVRMRALDMSYRTPEELRERVVEMVEIVRVSLEGGKL